MNNDRPSRLLQDALEEVFGTPKPDERFIDGLEAELRARITTRKPDHVFSMRWSMVRQIMAAGALALSLLALLVIGIRLIPKAQTDVEGPSLARTTSTPVFIPPAAGATAGRTPFTYTVKPGQTLAEIAAEVGVPSERLIQLNHLDAKDPHIQPGQRLVIGYYDQATPAPVSGQTTPQGLNLDSPHDQIRQFILQPQWDTLWVEGKISEPNAGEGPQEWATYTQAYLARDGRGRMLTSKRISGFYGFNLDVGVDRVAAFDGQTQTHFEMDTKSMEQFAGAGAWVLHPLETENRLTQMLFPAELSLNSQDVTPLREEMWIDRAALVVDWAQDRLWVDEATGVILRQEHYLDTDRSTAPLYSVEMTHLVFGVEMSEAILRPTYLDELAFELPPNQGQAPPASEPVFAESTAGWIYLETSRSAPFEWTLARFPADCLANPAPCDRLEYLPGQPNVQITQLAWSPDFSQAAFSDTNHNKLVIYDPVNKSFQRVLDIFLQNQLFWSPDGERIAGIGASELQVNNRLVVIERAGWSETTVETNFANDVYLYGWLDEQHLLVSDYRENGGLYRVNVETGDSELLNRGGLEASLSPDGQTLAAAVTDGTANVIVTMRKDGSNPRSLGVEGGNPSWSPDGTWIVFYSSSPSGSEVQLIRQDGTGLLKDAFGTATFGSAWSPDSQFVLAQTGEPGNSGSNGLIEIRPASEETRAISIPALDEVPMWFLLGWTP